MNSRLFKICSLILSLVLLINMLPLNVWAEQMDTVAKVETQTNVEPAQAEVLGEVTEKRTQYTKDYRLNNGFYVSAVYAEPVHFEEDGQWEEIDNTLKAHSDGTYGNTAGVWDVRFPQTLTQDRNVTITKDGYTLSFGMAGELRNQGNLEIAGVEDNVEPAAIGAADIDATLSPAPLETASVNVGEKTEIFAVNNAKISAAQILAVDDELAKESAKYEEMVLTKTTSGLMYNNVYGTTDIQYDLQSNKVKESVILESYDADLRGFRYNLDVGELVPVLNDDGSIDFYDAKEERIVMVMPAPFLIDDAMVTNHDIRVVLNGTGSNYTLIYMLPHSWLAEDGRSWPVILDPAIFADPNALTNLKDRTVAENKSYAIDDVYLYCGNFQSNVEHHTYIMFTNLPKISSSDVIVSAQLTLQRYGGTSNTEIPIEAHKVTETWTNDTLSWNNKPAFDEKVEDYQIVDVNDDYHWDITDVVRDWYSGENTGVMFKADSATEAAGTVKYSRFYSSDTGAPSAMPTLTVLYRNNNGLESYWNYTSASAGRAGTGHVNSYTGNLTWVREIMGFGGNRMPVNINLVYNLNDRSNKDFGMGNGWRTNFNQRIYTWDEDYRYYVWEDDDGTDHYFLASGTHVYEDEDGLELTLRTQVSGDYPYTITDKKGNTRHFDSKWRLAKIENNQETKSSITITYTSNSGSLINEIRDGVNRSYKFTYDSSNRLIRIDYYGTDSTIDYTTQFNYTNYDLTSITDKDGNSSTYSYNSDQVLTSASDYDGYKLEYTYYEPEIPTNTSTVKWQPYRVKTVAESHGSKNGGTLTLEYGHNQTTFTDHNQNMEIMQFNDYGNAVSVQDGLGRAQFMKFAINNESEKEEVDASNDEEEKTKKPNQIRLSSKMQNTVTNLLTNTSFEEPANWTSTSTSAITVNNSTSTAYIGNSCMKLMGTASANASTGAYSPPFTVAKGETVTFSAYVKTAVNGTKLSLFRDGGQHYTSAPISTLNSWVRAEVSYTNNTEQTQTLKAFVFSPGSGNTYVDCVQVEKMPAASRYNMVQNGDFRSSVNSDASNNGSNNWSGSVGSVVNIGSFEPPQQSAAPQLDTNVYKMTGSITETRRISQTINVKGSTGDTFVLAGWAKGDSVPLPEAEDGEIQRQFAIIGQFYNNGTAVGEEVIAQFNPDANIGDTWQYVAQPMIADDTFDKITITLAYDYNANDVYFDGIQLFKEEFGSTYRYDDKGNVDSISDEEGETTDRQYNDNNDLIWEELPTGITVNYEYDNWHNVTKATYSDGRVEETEYDTWGNVESLSVGTGTNKITTSYYYTDDGNRLRQTIDEAGNITNCWYNAQTNVLEWTQQPKDSIDDPTTTTVREGTATYYGYDNLYRTTSVSAIAAEDKDSYSGIDPMFANYQYENDMLKSITTASTPYIFSYGNFGLRTKVTAGGYELAEYHYSSDGNSDDRNHYLLRLEYGNNDSVEYDYDNYGRVTRQEYEDNDYVTYQYDNDGELAAVYDSSTDLTTKYYYDFAGRYGAVEQRDDTNLVFRVGESYDEHNRLTTQSRQYASGSYTDSYTYNQNGTLQGMVLGNIRGIGYNYDSLWRVTAMNTGTDGVNGRTFTYYTEGEQNTSRIKELKYSEIKNKPNQTELIFSYTYDDNGNIASYTAPNEGTVTYEYDTQNQLLSATGNGSYHYTYDRAGNITQAIKNGTTYHYTYGKSNWGDLLATYNGASIGYDDSGNPTSYYNGWNFTWEHGRELTTATKTGQSLSFTYDADGIRKTKTVNGVVHTYYYAGGKLARETYGSNVLDFFYDQNGHPFMLVYNGAVYYYIVNAQGDVIRLVDINGNIAAMYQYDPYGNSVVALGSHATINPLRYRGYYYDSESGLYYLQSRYYDPNIGRFINADALASTGQGVLGNNMLTYCLNNPVNMADFDGKDAFYVTQTSGDNSLPVVGHALLYIQDEEGTWYTTEFTGTTKKNAKVTVYPTDLDMVEKMLNGEPVDGKQYTFIEGDFSQSVVLANSIAEENPSYGKYNLLINNCLHYVQEILSAGDFETPYLKEIIMSSPNIIPIVYHSDIARGRSRALIMEVLIQ